MTNLWLSRSSRAATHRGCVQNRGEAAHTQRLHRWVNKPRLPKLGDVAEPGQASQGRVRTALEWGGKCSSVILGYELLESFALVPAPLPPSPVQGYAASSAFILMELPIH